MFLELKLVLIIVSNVVVEKHMRNFPKIMLCLFRYHCYYYYYFQLIIIYLLY